jgi:sugar O-acyltransferase (sialic acid O-acetyltransferase NeuD family)
MLIVGAGGLAAQLFEDLIAIKAQDIVFWSEVETRYGFIEEKFKIVRSDEEVLDYFNSISKSFILCIGSIEGRKIIGDKFKKLGGRLTSFISHNSIISQYITVGAGSIILSRVEIEAGVVIGEECLINKTANIGHGCILGANCQISPGVILAGEVELGENTYVGTRAIVLPKVKVGKNVTISAGSVVKKNIPDNAVVTGEFAKIKFYRTNESKYLPDNI